jgi:hypothetical protein
VKDAITDFSALAGFACLVTAGFMVALPLGVAALGIAFLAIAAGLVRMEDHGQSAE